MSKDTQETKQVGNVVLGHQAGGDISNVTTVYVSGAVTPMARLIAKYRLETEQDRQIKQTIEDLQRWQQREGDVLGLEEKLRQGGRVELLDVAVLAKERFARALVRHELSPAAQKIYAFLLAKVYQLFSQVIYPQICRGADVKEIDQLLTNEVYARVEVLFEDNPLGLTPEDVMGMLYWLTGNIEDKGMTIERSRNFQRNIVGLSKRLNIEHQIIFTTSMIDPTLDTPEFTIGPNYVAGHKTLEVKAEAVPTTSEPAG